MIPPLFVHPFEGPCNQKAASHTDFQGLSDLVGRQQGLLSGVDLIQFQEIERRVAMLSNVSEVAEDRGSRE